ncbi:hypothetical protein [Piscibacillus salipiscarius]|uniref:Uncharacterized protein n=1 Tax=Piscibacillus salipiscarius TaxID=299480 RepID=A0ABW5QAU3_9BACI|nr:hypothetical protein [Piscibacillus salipiscarius]
MKINFTKKQYKQLLDLAFLGEFFGNGTRMPDERDKAIHDIYQYVLSFADRFQMDDLIEYEGKFDEYMPTREFEEQLEEYINKYDNDSFWEELPAKLAKRDIDRSGETFENGDDYMRRLFEIEAKYEEEFEKHGINRLYIKEK